MGLNLERETQFLIEKLESLAFNEKKYKLQTHEWEVSNVGQRESIL